MTMIEEMQALNTNDFWTLLTLLMGKALLDANDSLMSNLILIVLLLGLEPV